MLKQVELALAYGCVDSVGSEMLVQYIHHNRNHNARRIQTMGNIFTNSMILIKYSTWKLTLKTLLYRENLYRVQDRDEKRCCGKPD